MKFRDHLFWSCQEVAGRNSLRPLFLTFSSTWLQFRSSRDVGTCPDKLVLRLADGKERVLCDLPAEEGKRLRAAASAVLGKTK